MSMRPITYENQELEGQRLELTAEDGHYCLGPNLTLRRCTVILRVSSRWLHVRSANFIDCTFEVKRDLKNFQDWVYASLQGCRFRGRLPGCEFGNWPGYPGPSEHGSIENCDFTEARLDGCRFHRCDLRTLQLPRWPYFTFVHPLERMRELRSARWPEHFKSVIIDDLAQYPPSTTAVTWHAPSVTKGMGTTPEGLKTIIDTLDCIVC